MTNDKVQDVSLTACARDQKLRKIGIKFSNLPIWVIYLKIAKIRKKWQYGQTLTSKISKNNTKIISIDLQKIYKKFDHS